MRSATSGTVGYQLKVGDQGFFHANSTWPHSREVVARDMGYLSPEVRAKLVRENVARLYNMPIPEPMATPPR